VIGSLGVVDGGRIKPLRAGGEVLVADGTPKMWELASSKREREIRSRWGVCAGVLRVGDAEGGVCEDKEAQTEREGVYIMCERESKRG
jgi:hypothetical protein